MEKPSGSFDIANVTMASKIVLVAGILLLVDSFLAWQKVCVSDIVGSAAGIPNYCAKANAWGGSGSFAGFLMGILLIVLLIWEAVQLSNMQMNLSIGVTAEQGQRLSGMGRRGVRPLEVRAGRVERAGDGRMDRPDPVDRHRVRLVDAVPGTGERGSAGSRCGRRRRRLQRLIDLPQGSSRSPVAIATGLRRLRTGRVA